MIENKHVLALEDEPLVAFLIEDMLRDEGAAEVSIAFRLGEAEAVIAKGGIDLAILDVNVHGERSYAIADRLAAQQIPFIFASGYGDHEHPPAYDAVPTLTKPFNVDDLRKAIGRVKALDPN